MKGVLYDKRLEGEIRESAVEKDSLVVSVLEGQNGGERVVRQLDGRNRREGEAKTRRRARE